MNQGRIAILGGGLAGKLCAVSLARSGVSIDLFDPSPMDLSLSETTDHRTTAISIQSRKVLVGLGLWNSLRHHACPVNKMMIGGGNTPSAGLHRSMQMEAGEAGVESLAWIIENARLTEVLNAQLAASNAQSHITLFGNTTIKNLKPSGDGRVTLESEVDQSHEPYDLVIGCDGRQSLVRRQGMSDVSVKVEYSQHALVAILTHSKPHNNTATQVFLPDGPVALLPMSPTNALDDPRYRSSLIWSAKPQWVEAMRGQPADQLASSLQARLGDILGDVTDVAGVASYPLTAQVAAKFASSGMALVGDAAHAVHPLAGQGFNLTIGDIQALTSSIQAGQALGQPLGSALTLEGYDGERRLAAQKIFTLTDGLDRLLARRNPLASLARNIGFAALDPFQGPKTSLMQMALES